MKNAVLLILVSLITLELFSFAATEWNLLLFNNFPEVYRSQRYSGDDWRTQKDPWGLWHKTNATDRHQSRCFDVRYQSNEIGARDTPFEHIKPDGQTRYILLGDSFAEGYGVNVEDRAQAQLEKLLGIDVYNFGSIYFGPVQYYLIYKDLASQFQHDGVILFFLPANDFTDNDYSLWKNFHPSWYRPYYQRLANGQYDIFYPEHAVPTERYQDEIELSTIKRLLFRYTFTANTLRTIKYLFARNPLEKFGYSGYFDATQSEQEAAIYFIEKVVREARPRRVMIFVIPSLEDMKRIRAGQSYNTQYWSTNLNSLTGSNSNVDVIDMADYMPDDYGKLFLTCDSHWSALGNLAAAKIIAAKYRGRTSHSDAPDSK
jgi:hypothetical protein